MFKHPDEQREEMYVYWASISPEQRMENMIDLIIMSFGIDQKQLSNPFLTKRIRIISYHE